MEIVGIESLELTSEIRSVLAWQLEMGASEALADDPLDWSTFGAARSKVVKVLEDAGGLTTKEVLSDAGSVSNAGVVSSPNVTVSPPPSEAISCAKSLADAAKTLEDLKSAVTNFKELAICQTATKTVFGDGNSQADIMLIGEAPGASEDREGIPFCGESGRLLDKALACIGLNREDNVYISNSLFWRPPGNRRPTPEELQVCKPFVEKHIKLINPKLLILSGGTAAQQLLDAKVGITKLRGKEQQYKNQELGMNIPAFAVYHPSYLLRTPAAKRQFWQDLLTIQEKMKE